MKDVSELVKSEKESNFKPAFIDYGFTQLPLSQLSDRDFEILTYFLIKTEIEKGINSNIDSIYLMQGVSDGGRDCVGYKNEVLKTIVQCKKYNKKITRPQIMKELIKFLIYSLEQNEINELDCIDYHLYLSSELNGPASKLVEDYKNELELDIDSQNIDKYIVANIEEYESFEKYISSPPFDDIYALLRKTKITVCSSTDLSHRIQSHNNLMSNFFNVKTVVDLETNKKQLEEVLTKQLDERGFSYLKDADLKKLQSLISTVPDDMRFSFGIVDFYGFHVDMFESIDRDDFQSILDGVSKINNTLIKLQFSFLQKKLLDVVRNCITDKLILTGTIHPFFSTIALQYLTLRISFYFTSEMFLLPPEFQSEEELLTNVIINAKNEAELYLSGDYSKIKGSLEEINYKINNLFPIFYQGIDDISDLENIIKLQRPILEKSFIEAESILKNYFFEVQTIVIKKFNLNEIDEVEKTKRALDKMK